jgi:hypothetical protein
MNTAPSYAPMQISRAMKAFFDRNQIVCMLAVVHAVLFLAMLRT